MSFLKKATLLHSLKPLFHINKKECLHSFRLPLFNVFLKGVPSNHIRRYSLSSGPSKQDFIVIIFYSTITT
jgi:hypothetical protein